MAELDIGHERKVFIDDDDIHLTEGRAWHARRTAQNLYVASKETRNGRTEVIYLHRLIAGAGRERVGFVNGDSFDCRRINLAVKGMQGLSRTPARGALGEALVIADLTRHGHDVFAPIAGHTAADLVSISPEGAVMRWQVKLRSMQRFSSSLVVSLSAIHPLKGGYLRKPYDLSAIDGFAVCCLDPESIFYVPVGDIDLTKQSFSICLGPRAHNGNSRNSRKYKSPNIK